MVQYVCYKCKSKISNDIRKRFIAENGVCLCEKCSIGMSPCSASVRKKLIELELKENAKEN